MATDSTNEFDLGPLSWVQGEIDQALTRGIDSLATFREAPADPAPLKHARTHIHQAAGAIQMVGLDAVVAFSDEIERQLALAAELDPRDVPPVCDLVDKACRKLRIFLDELVKGAPPVPLKLFPEYELMQRSRGIKASAPTDLFYPDLGPRAPRLATPQVIPPNKLPSYMVKQRRLYQRGLLAWLRGDDEGATVMRDAVAGIESATTQQNLRAFWWTVGALLDALVERGLEPGFGVKQLAARVDLQIRRVVEGSGKVADRLRREVLYYVAISAPIAPSVQAVQRGFRLGGLIPSAEVLNADLVRIQPHLRDARELLNAAKDAWLKFTSGRPENLPKLKQTLASVHKHAAEVGNGALMKLTAALIERLNKLPQTVSESFAMEYATGILLAESAFENYASLSQDFPKQVEAMIARLGAAQLSRPAPGGAAAPLLDEMSKRAQERVLLAQVGREIQMNLRHMEQVLDAFFRDSAKRGELATLTKDSQQIRGALRMLGLDDAEQLLGLCEAQIDSYANPETEVPNEDLELLAEALSGLGFYIEAVEQQRPDRERLIAPLLAKRLGEAPKLAADDRSDSVEAAVKELRAALPKLVEEVRHAPADVAIRESLRAKLANLRDDAELIGDEGLLLQAEVALNELDAGGAGALAAAVEAIADGGAAAPAPEISEETQRLLDTDARGLDAELVGIYLEEAGEVLETIDVQRHTLDGNPGDREALRTVRRQFHTLKGSGRMVGLAELGELAFSVEKILNRLLEDDHPVTPAVMTMIATAHREFAAWVEAISAKGRVAVDPGVLHAAIEAVEGELPHGRESALHPTPAAPEPVVETPPDAHVEAGVEAPDVTEDAELFALPELGSMQEGSSPQVIPLFDAQGEHSPHSVMRAAPVRDAPAREPAPLPDVDFAPEPVHGQPDLVSAPEPTSLPAEGAQAETDEITVGDVKLSATLFQILVDEADQHLATLAREQEILQFDSSHVPSTEMVRASHTLCGIHRTGGFPLVAGTAKSLEQCLIGLAERGTPLPGAAQPILARAIEGLRVLVGRVHARAGFTASDAVEAAEIQQELETLRQEATPEPGLADAEAQAEREAARALHDEEHASAPPVAVPAGAQVPEPDSTSAPRPAIVTELRPAATPAMPAPEASASPAMASLAAAAAAPEPEIKREAFIDVRDDVDRDVLPIFLDEAAELFPQAGEQLRAWRRQPGSDEHASKLRRTLHTFKGSARMAGAMRLGELTHLMESRLVAGDTPVAGAPALFDALDDDLDRIAFVLEALREGRTNVSLPWLSPEIAATFQAETAPASERVPASPVADRPITVSTEPIVGALAPAAAPATAVPAVETDAAQRPLLRVRADMIDRLVNEAGEVAITRARVEGELRALKSNLLELTGSVIRLRTQVREIEIQGESQIQSRMSQVGEAAEGFDPLEFDRYTRFQELTRSLAEGVNDVSTVQQSLLKNLDDADAALVAQARLSRDVQQQLFSIRTVPFGSMSERLYRILRATAKELDKRANLEIRGGQTELDRSVLEKLAGPLEHLLRNALDHGVEARATRIAAGKAETGEITLTVRQVGNEIAIEIADDGAGLDFAQIRARAIALGRIAADAQTTDAQLIEFIFEPGFSTATRVTQVSGRGIGMDVVRAEIAALGGRVEVSSRPGRGTTFLLYLPLTLAVAQAVLVRAGGRLWALPAPMVEQVQQVRAEALLSMYAQHQVEWKGVAYPLHYLPRLLGDAQHNPETARFNALLLLRAGQSTAAIHVDEMVGNQEVVVKNIGPQLARVSGIAGATVLGTGEIVLIINPVQLAQRANVPTFDPHGERVTGHADVPAPAAVAPLAMIVDDSLTVRKITGRLLTRAGFRVVAARDGIDALQLLDVERPDVILLDIEMPRMDGFEFTKTIKGDPRNAHIPIVMITSRTAEKHRNRARELGVDLFLGKPFQEEELIRNLRDMLAFAAPA
jgi:chemosensory pili system protein ChpA (sensor histidine kinase/response regulator)